MTVGLVSHIFGTDLKIVYCKRVKGIQPMNATELKALAQDLRNERTEALRAADNAQACLNEVQRKLAILKLQEQYDTPMADLYGG